MRNKDKVRDRWVYHLLDRHRVVLYVGITCAPMSRLDTHSKSRDKEWWAEVKRVRWIYLGKVTGYEAEKIEREHMESNRPRYNRRTGTGGRYLYPVEEPRRGIV
jgi:predicted GIY-YIG superfamily endonuclease